MPTILVGLAEENSKCSICLPSNDESSDIPLTMLVGSNSMLTDGVVSTANEGVSHSLTVVSFSPLVVLTPKNFCFESLSRCLHATINSCTKSL